MLTIDERDEECVRLVFVCFFFFSYYRYGGKMAPPRKLLFSPSLLGWKFGGISVGVQPGKASCAHIYQRR